MTDKAAETKRLAAEKKKAEKESIEKIRLAAEKKKAEEASIEMESIKDIAADIGSSPPSASAITAPTVVQTSVDKASPAGHDGLSSLLSNNSPVETNSTKSGDTTTPPPVGGGDTNVPATGTNASPLSLLEREGDAPTKAPPPCNF